MGQVRHGCATTTHAVRAAIQRSQASLATLSRELYCCSDGVRGRGAPMTYLSHTASFHSNEGIAPSNRGIKHLESAFVRRRT